MLRRSWPSRTTSPPIRASRSDTPSSVHLSVQSNSISARGLRAQEQPAPKIEDAFPIGSVPLPLLLAKPLIPLTDFELLWCCGLAACRMLCTLVPSATAALARWSLWTRRRSRSSSPSSRPSQDSVSSLSSSAVCSAHLTAPSHCSCPLMGCHICSAQHCQERPPALLPGPSRRQDSRYHSSCHWFDSLGPVA